MDNRAAVLEAAGVDFKRAAAWQWAARKALLLLSGALMLVNLYLIFIWSPPDVAQGQASRILYLHVPIVLGGFGALFLVLVGSLMYLVRRRRGWDRLAHASAEVGVLLITLTLITGSIWAKPIWGVWWQWEPRLTTAFVLWLVYVAYLMVRAYAPNRAQAATYAAAIGIVGFVNVPITYMSVIWWRTVHPAQVIGPAAEEGALAPEIGITLMFSFLAFWAFIAALLMERVAQRRLEDDLEAMKSVLAEQATEA